METEKIILTILIIITIGFAIFAVCDIKNKHNNEENFCKENGYDGHEFLGDCYIINNNTNTIKYRDFDRIKGKYYFVED